MSPNYTRFLEFFESAGPARLDGLDSSYFSSMTPAERSAAFDFLLERVRSGGTTESVHGLFLADPERAAEESKELLETQVLRPEAEIVAAWSLYKGEADVRLLSHFIKHFSSPSADVRASAAYYVPARTDTIELVTALRSMILVETEKLPLIHSVNKLLECHGITQERDIDAYQRYYRELRGGDFEVQKRAFAKLDRSYPLPI